MKKVAGETTAPVERLSKEAVETLKKWYEEHESNPYPSKEEKAELALTTKLTKGKELGGKGWSSRYQVSLIPQDEFVTMHAIIAITVEDYQLSMLNMFLCAQLNFVNLPLKLLTTRPG